MKRSLGRIAAAGLLAAGCGSEAGTPPLEETTTVAARPTTTSTSREPTTATTVATTMTPTTDPVREIDACELFDADAARTAGFELDEEPRVVTLDASRSEEDADALAPDHMEALYHCDLSFSAALIVWDAESPAVAAAAVDDSLRSASRDGELPVTALPRSVSDHGATVVDVEFDNSTVQWQSGDLHLVINLLSFSAAGLSPAELQGVLEELAAFAQHQL